MPRTTDTNDGSGTATGLVGTARPAWRARPRLATAIRLLALCGPVAISVAVVFLAARTAGPPDGSRASYVAWWVALSGAATVSLVAAGRLSRRLLPLAALMRLSLVFPDSAPSRFRTALRTGTVATLEERLTATRRGDDAPHADRARPAAAGARRTPGRARPSHTGTLGAGPWIRAEHRARARPRLTRARPPQLGGPAPRHRQARGPARDPGEPPQADGGRVGDTPHAPDVRRRARGPAAGVAGRVERRDRAAPRAVGRNGVSAWPGRQRDLAGGPDRRGRGRVRRDHLRPLVQAPILGRRGEEGALAVRRYSVRPGRRPRIPRDFGAPEPSRGPARMARPRRDARATAGDAGGRPVRRGRGGGSGCGRRRGRGVGRPSGDDREAGARNTGRGGATRRASARRRRPASPAGRARRTAQREARGHAGEAASSRGARAEGDAAAAEAPRRYGASRSAEAARRLPGLAEAAVCARATDTRRASSRVRTRHPAAPRPPGRASAAAACRTCSRGRRDSDDRERNGRGGVRRADRDDARHSSGGDSSSSASARVFSASDSADITSGSDSTGVPDPRTPPPPPDSEGGSGGLVGGVLSLLEGVLSPR